MSSSSFSAKVLRLVDFDFDEPTPGYENCVELTLNSVRGLMSLGQTVTLILPSGGSHKLTLKGTPLGDERPVNLRTGELPLLLRKPPEIAQMRLAYQEGMHIESARDDDVEEL